MMKKLKKDFPALARIEHGRPLVYLNNASTTHKPQSVIDRISHFYAHEYDTVYRGIYAGAERVTEHYEAVRARVAQYIGARPDEIIFTKGTTEGINFIATAWARAHLHPGDEIVLTHMEHHANLIPWQQVARHTGAVLKFIPLTPHGTLDLSTLDDLITSKTKLVSVVHVSHVLGVHNDVSTLSKAARSVGAKFLVDAAQSVGHQPLNVATLGCDFLAFSGHKMLGPTGIGVLYINHAIQNEIDPYQFGGGMVSEVTFSHATWAQPPQRFEAGTPAIAQVIGLGAAIDYLQQNIDFVELQRHEAALCAQVIDGLTTLERVRILGPIDELKRCGHLVSFIVEGMHAHDVAAYLDAHAIAARAGHHCAQPLMKLLGIPACVRVSFYAYNSAEEIDYFLNVMRDLR